MRYLRILLIILISVLLLVFFFKDVNFEEVGKIVSSINPLYPLAFFFGAFLQYVVRAYRWGIILKAYKKEKIPLLTLYNFTAIGFFLNLLPGRLGEPARGILLAQEEKIEKSFGLASVVVERLIDFVMMILIFLLSLFFLRNNDSLLLTQIKQVSFYLLPVLVAFFFLFYFLNFPRIFSFVERVVKFCAKILPQRLRDATVRFILNFLKGLKLNLPAREYVKLIFSSAAVWIVVIYFYWILIQGFSMDITFYETIPYFSILVVFAAIPTPGMTGTIDMGSKLGLTQLYNVPSDLAVAFTLLVHAQLLITWVVLGLAAFWMQGLSFNVLKRIEEQENNEVS